MQQFTFNDFVEMLPQGYGGNGGDRPCFSVPSSTRGVFVQPTINEDVQLQDEEAKGEIPTAWILTARGAAGKSRSAEEVANRREAIWWRLEEDDAVGSGLLFERLAKYLGTSDVDEELQRRFSIGKPVFLVVDSIDEARTRVLNESWSQFVASLCRMARCGMQLMVCGRRIAAEDLAMELHASKINVRQYEVSHFARDEQVAYVDSLASDRDDVVDHLPYREARDIVLNRLRSAVPTGESDSFVGYPPVLDALARLLASGANYARIKSDFQNLSSKSSTTEVLFEVLDHILLREQGKFAPTAEEYGVDVDSAYTPIEQMEWLLSRLLGQDEPDCGYILDDESRNRYTNSARDFNTQHPFASDSEWASPVFSAYVIARRLREVVAIDNLIELGSQSGLLFDFAATLEKETVSADSWKIAALRASMAAGKTVQAQVQTEVEERNGILACRLSTRLGEAIQLQLTIEYEPDGQESFRIRGPLDDISVDCDGLVIIGERPEKALLLGPNFSIRSKSVEIIGSEISIAMPEDQPFGGAPSVFIAAEEFDETWPRLTPVIQDSAFELQLPQTPAFPWIRYFTKFEPQEGFNEIQTRAFHFVRRLLALTRRHGHKGRYAVYVSKLRGQTGLKPDVFTRALDVLIDTGVVDYEPPMVFVKETWEDYRFSANLVGPNDFATVRGAWLPVIDRIADVL